VRARHLVQDKVLRAIKKRIPAHIKRPLKAAWLMISTDSVKPNRVEVEVEVQAPAAQTPVAAACVTFNYAAALREVNTSEAASNNNQRQLLCQWLDLKNSCRAYVENNLHSLDGVSPKIVEFLGSDGEFDARILAEYVGQDEYLTLSLAQLRQIHRLLQNYPASPVSRYPLMSAADFRQFLDGKTVALVANSAALLDSRRGSEIDGHDCVIRFNSYKIVASDTGAKTDVHAAIHLHSYNLQQHVPVRIIFSGSRKLWEKSVREKVDPKSQDRLGDASLHWPVRSTQLVAESGAKVPTTGYNMIRLIDLYGVAKEVNLYGFDGYASAPLRLDEAMHLPIADAHEYSAETAWLMEHTIRVDSVKKKLI